MTIELSGNASLSRLETMTSLLPLASDIRRVRRQGFLQSVIATLQHLHLLLSFQHLLCQELGPFTTCALTAQQAVVPATGFSCHDCVQDLQLVFTFLDCAFLLGNGLLVVVYILYCLEDRVWLNAFSACPSLEFELHTLNHPLKHPTQHRLAWFDC